VTKNIQEAEQQRDRFRQLVDEYNKRVKNATDRFAELDELKRKAADTRAMLQTVRNNITDIGVESNAPARVRLASPASVPGDRPDNKRRFRYVVMGLVFSLGAGFAAGFLREISDQGIHWAHDVSSITPLPVIAAVPQISEDKSVENVYVPFMMHEHANCVYADEVRRILARVLYPEELGSEPKTLAVVSPTRGDGKTSLVSNLAIALAGAGRRVLVVDLCAKRPGIEAAFRLEPVEGLAELLQGLETTESLIRTSSFTNLYVLGPGRDCDALGNMLASREMTDFLEWAGKTFDNVLLDLPPVLIMSTAKLIGPLVDGVVVVVGSGASTRGMVKRCLHEMQQVESRVIGVVLNGLRGTRGGYFKSNLKLYYAYSHDPGNGKQQYADIPEVKVVDDDAVVMLPPVGDDDPKET
jgi:capsular exopolysaccharide synthesis family protein